MESPARVARESSVAQRQTRWSPSRRDLESITGRARVRGCCRGAGVERTAEARVRARGASARIRRDARASLGAPRRLSAPVSRIRWRPSSRRDAAAALAHGHLVVAAVRRRLVAPGGFPRAQACPRQPSERKLENRHVVRVGAAREWKLSGAERRARRRVRESRGPSSEVGGGLSSSRTRGLYRAVAHQRPAMCRVGILPERQWRSGSMGRSTCSRSGGVDG